ncbi:MAG TPA: hypothetical protein VMU90_12415 [Solirubrobacteraceae bacterium]|nr:hypothetical protein [Solirubrobacteraceae bacterium]
MPASANALRWTGQPGHYEVYYVTLTEPSTGVGLWIRYTMVAPKPGGDPATCSLWFLAMDPRPGASTPVGRKASFGIDQLSAQPDPFELRIGEAVLSDAGMSGRFEDVAWELSWTPAPRAYESVHPMLQRLGAAQTVLVLPHADVSIDGHVTIGEERIEVAGVRGGQAHLWGSKHARAWAWVHCNDFVDHQGQPVPDTFIDGVSVVVSRLGREVGPSTPVVARIWGHDFLSTSPPRILRNRSEFELSGWRFEARDHRYRLVGRVEAQPHQLAGVTYHDPDGELAYCYNSEIASLHLEVYDRARSGGTEPTATLVSSGRAHFEYAQRTPVSRVELLTR